MPSLLFRSKYMTRTQSEITSYNWVSYTVCFGLAPVVFRLLFATVDAATDLLPGETPFILPADVAFFGIMLNVATAVNVSSATTVPRALGCFAPITSILASFLAVLYTLSSLMDTNHYILWVPILLLLVPSAILSFLSTKRAVLQEVHDSIHMSEQIGNLPPIMRKVVLDKLSQSLSDGNEGQLDDMKRILDKYEHRKALEELARDIKLAKQMQTTDADETKSPEL